MNKEFLKINLTSNIHIQVIGRIRVGIFLDSRTQSLYSDKHF